MVGNVSSLTIPTISYISGQHGKVAFPVDPSSLIYSNFEHVSGMRAPEGTQGVSITKLNLVDVLIGMVNRLNKTPASHTPANINPTKGIDNIIESLQNQIRQARAASKTIPYNPTPNAESGVLFKLLS